MISISFERIRIVKYSLHQSFMCILAKTAFWTHINIYTIERTHLNDFDTPFSQLWWYRRERILVDSDKKKSRIIFICFLKYVIRFEVIGILLQSRTIFQLFPRNYAIINSHRHSYQFLFWQRAKKTPKNVAFNFCCWIFFKTGIIISIWLQLILYHSHGYQ